VDNYRDSVVIDNTVSLLITLINFLYENYSDQLNSDCHTLVIEYVQKLFESTLLAFKEICKFNTTIKLNFEKILEKIAEKPSNKGAMIYILNFMFNIVNNEYTLETFVEILTKPQKAPLVDIYTELENGFALLKPHNYGIKIGNFTQEKSFIKYLIDIAVNTNNEWIVSTSSELLINILRTYLDKSKGKLNEEIFEYSFELLNQAYNKISKVNALIMQDREVENFLPSVDYVFRIIKFLILFLKSEYKFIYIFHDISTIYLKILQYNNEYLKNSNNLIKSSHVELKMKILDVNNLILDSYVIILDSNRGFKNHIQEDLNANNVSEYIHLVEELPNKDQILMILNYLGSNYLEKESLNEIFSTPLVNKNILNKKLILVNKVMKILLKLSQNFYGQILLLYSDFNNGVNNYVPRAAKPVVYLNDLITLINEKLNEVKEMKDFDLSTLNLISITENLVKSITVLFYDLPLIEFRTNSTSSLGNSSENNFEINNEKLFTRNLTGKNENYTSTHRIDISDTRYNALINTLVGKINTGDKNEGIISLKNSMSTLAINIDKLNSLALEFSTAGLNDINPATLFNRVNAIKSNLEGVVTAIKGEDNCSNNSGSISLNIITTIDPSSSSTYSMIKLMRLPNARKILDKCTTIRKHYEFSSTQNYGCNLPVNSTITGLSTSTNTSSNNQSSSNVQSTLKDPSNNKFSDYNNNNNINKQHINEFEKLLNWKKYRIYLSKMDYLIIRKSPFDLDLSLKFQAEESLVKMNISLEILTESLNYKRKMTYVNSEPFQQFCNQMQNENLILEKFANLAYSITSANIHSIVFNSEDDEGGFLFNTSINKLLYKNFLVSKYELEHQKSNKGNNTSTSNTFAHITKKKVNSKLNTFVYKPKYDKLPKPLFAQAAASSATANSIRDTNRLNSMVSGRPLSMHVDKVDPRQGVVNLTYASVSASNTEEVNVSTVNNKTEVGMVTGGNVVNASNNTMVVEESEVNREVNLVNAVISNGEEIRSVEAMEINEGITTSAEIKEAEIVEDNNIANSDENNNNVGNIIDIKTETLNVAAINANVTTTSTITSNIPAQAPTTPTGSVTNTSMTQMNNTMIMQQQLGMTQPQGQTSSMPTNKPPLVNPQLNLRMMAPQNFGAPGNNPNMNPGFMVGGFNPMNQMNPMQNMQGMPNKPNMGNMPPQMGNINAPPQMGMNPMSMNTMNTNPNYMNMQNMQNMQNMGNVPSNMPSNMPPSMQQFNYGGMRPPMGMNPMNMNMNMNMNPHNMPNMNQMNQMGNMPTTPYGQNYPMSNMNKNLGMNPMNMNMNPHSMGMNPMNMNIPGMMPNMQGMNMPFSYSQNNPMMNPNMMNQGQGQGQAQNVNPSIANEGNKAQLQGQNVTQNTPSTTQGQQQAPQTTSNITQSQSQPQNPPNVNLLTNIMQAFNQLHKLGTTQGQGQTQTQLQDKSKDPRTRKKKA
jgi:hypothetical protein